MLSFTTTHTEQLTSFQPKNKDKLQGRKDLGDIDLVWGDIKIGLRKILDKHINDFSEFGNDINAVGKALDEIISKGTLVNKNGVETIWYKKGDNFYLVGLAKGYKKVGDNKWIITSYKKTKGDIPDEVKGNTANLSAYSGKFKGELTSSHPPLTSNADTIPKNTLNNNKMKGGFTTQAMVKNIVSSGIGGGIGAYSAPNDKKLEGFIIGALGGMGASNFGGISHSAVNLVKNMIKTPKGIDKAIEKGVDKGLVGVANKFLSKEAAKTWSDIGGNVGNIKYLFANTLDKSYEKVRDSVTGELNAMFNKYVNLSGVLNQLSKKDNKAFYDFLANNGSIENLSPEIRKFANDVRNQIIKEFEYQMGE